MQQPCQLRRRARDGHAGPPCDEPVRIGIVDHVRGSQGHQESGDQGRPRPAVAPAWCHRSEDGQSETHGDHVQCGGVVLDDVTGGLTAQLADDLLGRIPALAEPMLDNGLDRLVVGRCDQCLQLERVPGRGRVPQHIARGAHERLQGGLDRILRLLLQVTGHRRERQSLENGTQEVDAMPAHSGDRTQRKLGLLGDVAPTRVDGTAPGVDLRRGLDHPVALHGVGGHGHTLRRAEGFPDRALDVHEDLRLPFPGDRLRYDDPHATDPHGIVDRRGELIGVGGDHGRDPDGLA